MNKITCTTVRCPIGKCLGFLDISIESSDGKAESGGTLMNCKKKPELFGFLALIANQVWSYLHPILNKSPPVEYTTSSGIGSPRTGESRRTISECHLAKDLKPYYKDKTFFYAILSNIKIINSRTG